VYTIKKYGVYMFASPARVMATVYTIVDGVDVEKWVGTYDDALRLVPIERNIRLLCNN